MIKKISLFLFVCFSLSLSAQTYVGNQFSIMDMQGAGAFESIMTMNTNYKLLAFRFSIPTDVGDLTLDTIRLYFNSLVGSPTFQIRIETVDANDFPSGNLVDPNAVVPTAQSSTGSKTISFPGSFTLMAGQTYCIVIDPNGQAASSQLYDFRVSSPLNSFIGDSQGNLYSDNSLNVLFSTNSGTNWMVKNLSPTFALRNGGTYELGTPFNSKANVNINSSSVKVGEVFTAQRTLKISGISAYASKSGSPPPLQYEISLVDSLTLPFTVQSNLVSGQFGGYPYGWIDASFSSDITLVSNQIYLISFFAPGATGGNYLKVPGEKGWTGSFTWNGTSSYGIQDTGSGWQDFYATQKGDFAFRFVLSSGNTAPSNVILYSPIGTEGNQKPTFIWSQSHDIDGDSITYELDIDTGTDFGSDAIVYQGISQTNFPISVSLDTNITYYWRVIADDGRGGTTISAHTNFIVHATGSSNNPPSNFNLSSPVSETVTVSQPTFVWNSTTDPEDGVNITYDLIISPTNSFSSGVIFYQNLSSTNLTIEEKLRNNLTYYWKVIARDTTGLGTESAVKTFNIAYEENVATDKPNPQDKTVLYDIKPNVFDANVDNYMDIIFDVEEEGNVQISVYNVSGEKVASLLNGNLYSGRYKISWGGSIGHFNASAKGVLDVSSPVGMSGEKIGRGVYLVVLQTQDSKNIKKIFIK